MDPDLRDWLILVAVAAWVLLGLPLPRGIREMFGAEENDETRRSAHR